jgi:nucleotide sugar dehydrogenase
MKKNGKKIGFVGQGIVGKATADDFEKRGFDVVRYALEKEYAGNREAVSVCPIVFIAVPTPTRKGKQDISAIEDALALIHGKADVAIIRSTILPGTTERLQNKFEKTLIVHSPEFLIANSAAKDAAEPFVNVIGLAPKRFEKEKDGPLIKELHTLLPRSGPVLVCSSVEAEAIKFSHNVHGYIQIVFWNMMHDYASALGADWKNVKTALDLDPMISRYYTSPVHKNGRGAGGHCFIKDYSAFKNHYSDVLSGDTPARSILALIEKKNLELLSQSGKDLELVEKVYGKTADSKLKTKKKNAS